VPVVLGEEKDEGLVRERQRRPPWRMYDVKWKKRSVGAGAIVQEAGLHPESGGGGVGGIMRRVS